MTNSRKSFLVMKRNVLNSEGGGKFREVTETYVTWSWECMPSVTLEEVVTGGSNSFIKRSEKG